MTARTTQDTPDAAIVLVVDDSSSKVSLLQAHLEAEGYQVIAAYRGEEALEKAFACRRWMARRPCAAFVSNGLRSGDAHRRDDGPRHEQ